MVTAEVVVAVWASLMVPLREEGAPAPASVRLPGERSLSFVEFRRTLCSSFVSMATFCGGSGKYSV